MSLFLSNRQERTLVNSNSSGFINRWFLVCKVAPLLFWCGVKRTTFRVHLNELWVPDR